jgi:hypothetical protein
MTLEIDSYQWLSKTVNNSKDLVMVIKRASNVCVYCDVVTPMICVERCEIWRINNELLRINNTLCEDDYLHNLLNAVKNDRRRIMIEAFSEHPRSLKEL